MKSSSKFDLSSDTIIDRHVKKMRFVSVWLNCWRLLFGIAYYRLEMSSHYKTKEPRQILFEFAFFHHRHRRYDIFLSLSPSLRLLVGVMLFNAQHQRRLH